MSSMLDQILEQYPDEEFVKVDGYDDCIVGVVHKAGSQPVLLYSREKLIQRTSEKESWTHEESVEWHEFNTFPAYYGDGTPAFWELPHE
jgi:hypothetical protein